MGLFGMIGDVIGSLHDMKELGKIQNEVEEAVQGLISDGKCPEALKDVFDKVKNMSKDAPLEESMGTLKKFATELADNVDKLPDGIQKKVEKFADVVKDLEDRAEDIAKLTEKK